MITSLFSFSSLIQFIGAFNFANIYKPFHDAIFKHFLDVNYRFNKRFDAINEQIITDKESLSKVIPITTNDGRSNQERINSLKEMYDQLEKEKEEEIQFLNEKINRYYKPRYINSLFLLTALYCVFDLFLLALMEGMEYNDRICSYFSILNILYAFYIIYFIACELIFFNNWITNIHRLLRPTHLTTSIIAFSLLLIAFLIYYINNWIVGIFELRIINLEDLYISLYLSIIIPFSSFTTCITCVCILYKASTKCIEKSAKFLVQKYNELHKEKVIIDETYKQLSGISFGS